MNCTNNLTKLVSPSAVILVIVLIGSVIGVSKTKCNHPNRACFEDGSIVPNLYLYSKDDFNRYFNQHYPAYSIGTVWSVKRHPTGTYIYVQEFTSKKGFLVFAGGMVRLIQEPDAYKALDAKGDLIEINYKRDSSLANTHFLSDVGGEYFLSCNGRMKNVELRSITDPDKPLARSKLGAQRLFSIGDKVYLFGRDESSFKKNGYTKDIVCQVFKKTTAGLELESEVRIPRPVATPTPFVVEDIDGLTMNVALRDVRDPPGDDIYRLFNLDSRVMKTIYLSDLYGHPIFLRDDILGIAR